MLPIQEKYINYNYTSNGRDKIEYIVIHDTGNFSPGADAMAHYDYFNSANRNASADYFVDDSNIIKCVRDKDMAWHVGDGYGKYGITNANSIGIEICVNSDGNREKTIQNTLYLVKCLMNEHNVPFAKVVRHYDASRKNCPQTLNYNNWEGWTVFKNKLNDMLTKEHWSKQDYDELVAAGLDLDEFQPERSVTFGVLYAMMNKFRKTFLG